MKRFFGVMAIVLYGIGYNLWRGTEHIHLYPISPEAQVAAESCLPEACQALLHLITSAHQTIDFAIYGLRNEPDILQALSSAQQRGVAVRGVVDKDTEGENYYADTPKLETALKTVRSDGLSDQTRAQQLVTTTKPSTGDCTRPTGTAGPLSCYEADVGGKSYQQAAASEEPVEFSGDIMHNKFFIIDNQTVWLGSANISDTDTGGYNANMVITVSNKEVARWYEDEFAEMYAGRFHKTKKIHGSTTNLSVVLQGGVQISGYFSPQGQAMERAVVDQISQARHTVDIAVFYLTHKAVTTALLEALTRGVKVRVLLDATAAANAYSKHELLRQAGAQVKVENWGGKMHAKSACIDGTTLIVGSMNWTAGGDNRNDENTLVLQHVPDLAAEYESWFATLWQSVPNYWLTANPGAEGKDSPGSCTDGMDNDYDEKVDSADPGCRATISLNPK